MSRPEVNPLLRKHLAAKEPFRRATLVVERPSVEDYLSFQQMIAAGKVAAVGTVRGEVLMMEVNPDEQDMEIVNLRTGESPTAFVGGALLYLLREKVGWTDPTGKSGVV